MNVLREYIREVIVEADEQQDPLAAAMEGDKRFRVMTPPDPQREENVYYIASGARGVRYTLRVKWLEWQGGANEGGYRQLDRHSTTLGTAKNPQHILDKAAKIADGKIVYYEPRALKQRAVAGPRGIIKFGKHKGENVHDVVGTDPEYMSWMYYAITTDESSFLQKKHYKTFRDEVIAAAEASEAVMADVQRRKDEYEEKKKGWAAEKEVKRKAAEMRASSEHVGKRGERLAMTVTYEGSSDFEQQSYSGYGMETKYIHRFRDEDGNALVWWTTSPLGDLDDRGQWVPMNAGQQLRIKGTVKQHGDYKGEQNTTLARVKVLK